MEKRIGTREGEGVEKGDVEGREGIVEKFFFQAEGGIRDSPVTGVQTCALPIYWMWFCLDFLICHRHIIRHKFFFLWLSGSCFLRDQIGRASCRERV